jgi:hypothetical protein
LNKHTGIAVCGFQLDHCHTTLRTHSCPPLACILGFFLRMHGDNQSSTVFPRLEAAQVDDRGTPTARP